jgi:hypothetical protein
MHFPVSNSISGLQQPVSQSTFPMVNVGNNAEIPDVVHFNEGQK